MGLAGFIALALTRLNTRIVQDMLLSRGSGTYPKLCLLEEHYQKLNIKREKYMSLK